MKLGFRYISTFFKKVCSILPTVLSSKTLLLFAGNIQQAIANSKIIDLTQASYCGRAQLTTDPCIFFSSHLAVSSNKRKKRKLKH